MIIIEYNHLDNFDLTQEIESNAPESHSNFAGRCVNYALWMLKTDVEIITKSLDENAEEVLLRIKLIMRPTFN